LNLVLYVESCVKSAAVVVTYDVEASGGVDGSPNLGADNLVIEVSRAAAPMVNGYF